MIRIEKLITLAADAGKAILEVYRGKIEVEHKQDNSPLTLADKRSNDIIERGLSLIAPDVPVLSEEGRDIPFREREQWKEFWLVDPLDGTKEFIKRNGEFTVNIALIQGREPKIGVVHVPVLGVTYYSDGNKSYKIEKDGGPAREIRGSEQGKILRVVASKSHFTPETKAYLESLGKPYELMSRGSSLKLCMVAEGKADIYPRLGPTMEWDTAAAHAVARAAGKKVLKYGSDSELVYNKENLRNPWFIVM